eukprot:12265170-Prorocentrum_lima.AAC.1
MAGAYEHPEHENDNIQGRRLPGCTFDDVLHADDSALVSGCAKAIQAFLHVVEAASCLYGSVSE